MKTSATIKCVYGYITIDQYYKCRSVFEKYAGLPKVPTIQTLRVIGYFPVSPLLNVK